MHRSNNTSYSLLDFEKEPKINNRPKQIILKTTEIFAVCRIYLSRNDRSNTYSSRAPLLFLPRPSFTLVSPIPRKSARASRTCRTADIKPRRLIKVQFVVHYPFCSAPTLSSVLDRLFRIYILSGGAIRCACIQAILARMVDPCGNLHVGVNEEGNLDGVIIGGWSFCRWKNVGCEREDPRQWNRR